YATSTFIIVPMNSVANDNKAKTELTLYPNPVKDKLNLDLTSFGEAEEISIEVLDMLGKVIHAENQMAGESLMRTLDVSSFVAGSYIIRIETAAKRGSAVFIKN
ncbi:MAG TPA: T9SS type A sorting domain-containing protein, partial [Candidatus Kapabacteria bacterium]